ncbi:HNH endonuclease [Deltaproteobacteria bacterium]|nr:HNH endonuclease [Deltaproteobacteria bacterium]
MTAVLLLNADYKPMKVIPWEKAIWLVISEKALLVADYAGRLIRSQSIEMGFPAVIALKKYVRNGHKIRMSRRNVLARDHHVCQYCGLQPKTPTGLPDRSELSLDHIVPRAQSRGGRVTLPWSGKSVAVTSWENLVCACHQCNSDKADRTPKQAGMHLRKHPRRPSPLEGVRMAFGRPSIPEEWDPFIPSQWRGYWDVELDPS